MNQASPLALISLPPNRVRRNYLGGRELDQLEGVETPRDGEQPEDWIASTVEARNPGLPPIEKEGLAAVRSDDTSIILRSLFEQSPEFFLGPRHFKSLGSQLGFLAKLLDSSMRLHIQAHPTAAFAQAHLNSRWGKLETYVVLSVRPECPGYILLGFQRPPSPQEWKRIVFEQDEEAMQACFDRIPVAPGEVWLVPGGLPHAIGEGVLMLEVMEPSDLVVRCEFNRNGIIVPPEGRFMGRDPEFAMRIFDYEPLSQEDVKNRCRISPEDVVVNGAVGFSSVERLIGPAQTDCFRIHRLVASKAAVMKGTGRIAVGLVATGAGRARCGEVEIELARGSKFLLAAAANEIAFTPDSAEGLTLLIIEPGSL